MIISSNPRLQSAGRRGATNRQNIMNHYQPDNGEPASASTTLVITFIIGLVVLMILKVFQ